jgi:hypothetical protein
MKSLKLKKLIAVVVAALTIATMSPIGASAAWKENSNGWWNTEGSSWSTGWRSVDNSWYYFGSDGYMKTGWANDGGTWYYMQPSGAMKTGWVNDGGTWYYLQSSGAMKTGWVKDAGTWYYLQSSGAMKTGWVKDAGTWYYLQSSGAMKTGWVNDRGTWYFTSSTGAMQTGVIQIGGKVYYFAANGAMQTGNVTINGVVYTFAATGEAIGDNIPTPTLAFNTDGTSVALNTTGNAISSGHHSSGGGSSSNSSSSSSSSGTVVDKNDITSTISSVFASKVSDILKANPTLDNDISVDTTKNPIAVTLKNSNLDSLQNVFNAQNEPLNVIETRLTKAEGIMNTNSTMLSVGGASFSEYLAKADAKYVANGGNSNYFNADKSFNTTAIATKIKSNTLTYDQFKTDLADRIAGMSKAATSPVITITDGGIQVPVTKIQIEGQSTPIYDTTKSIAENAKGLVNLADATKGTYTIYTGTSYFKMKIS